MMAMKLEISNGAKDTTDVVGRAGGPVVMIGSLGSGEGGWLARVKIASGTALVLFPKYGLVAVEVQGCVNNVNLPAGCETTELVRHLFKSGKRRGGLSLKACEVPGATHITRKEAIAAVRLLKQAARDHHKAWGLNYTEHEGEGED